MAFKIVFFKKDIVILQFQIDTDNIPVRSSNG